MTHLRDQGFGIVIVTHKLGEVRQIADRVTVLRGGRVVLSGATPSDHTDPELIEAMVGRAVAPLARDRDVVPDDAATALDMKGVTARGDRGHIALKGVDLFVRRGRDRGRRRCGGQRPERAVRDRAGGCAPAPRAPSRSPEKPCAAR